MSRALLALLLVPGCSDERTVEIGFGAGARTPVGFRCRDDQGRFIISRAVVGRTLRFSLLIDFVGLGGLPTCRVGDIAAFCESHTCMPLATPGRVCIPIERDITGTDNAVTVMGAVLRELDGQVVTSEAPLDPVIIRAVASAQSCEELAGITAVNPAELIGCAVSCPVQLGGVDGEVVLELPTLSDSCAAGVVACATGVFGQ